MSAAQPPATQDGLPPDAIEQIAAALARVLIAAIRRDREADARRAA